MRVETYTEELIKKMVESGCVSAYFGLESMSQSVLMDMNKKQTVEQVKATSEQINKMLANAREVDEISGRMAEATTNQAKGSETILANTLEIEQMVQEADRQSSRLKEGSEALRKISNNLHEQMKFFKL